MRTKLLSRTEAAGLLGIKTQTLAAWATTHRYNLPYIKVGHRVMYRPDDLDAFIAANRHGVTTSVAS